MPPITAPAMVAATLPAALAELVADDAAGHRAHPTVPVSDWSRSRERERPSQHSANSMRVIENLPVRRSYVIATRRN
jgi:hypothetical protein